MHMQNQAPNPKTIINPLSKEMTLFFQADLLWKNLVWETQRKASSSSSILPICPDYPEHLEPKDPPQQD